MSTMPAPDRIDLLYERLIEFRARRRLVSFVGGALVWLALTFALLIATSLLAGLFTFAAAARTALLIAWLAVPLACAVRLCLLPLLRGYTDQELARRIEESLPDLNNSFINAVQLAGDESAASSELLRRAADEAATAAVDCDVRSAVSWSTIRRRATALLIVILASASLIVAAGGTLRHGALSILRPGRFVPRIGLVRIVSVEPGDVQGHIRGEPFSVQVTLQEAAPTECDARLFILSNDRPEIGHELIPLESGRTRF
ncbi:MAG: hypothetical protein IID33_14190, partial [Planctomycetes bacterium]|nr:hypothetical protein [Planctomycetota bacterium]